MRFPRPSTLAGVAVMATTLAVLPLTSASAAFDDGDYTLDESCGIEATLKVRGNGNGLSVTASTTMALVKDANGATIISFGEAGTANDNVVYNLSPADDGVACVEAPATDDEVAVLLGLEASTAADAYAAELSAADDSEPSTDEVDEAVEASEASDDEASDDEAEKVVLCHNVENNPHDIEVGASALDSHLDHGDLEGECPEDLVSKKSEKEEAREDAKADRDADKADRDADKADRDADKADRKADEADEATS